MKNFDGAKQFQVPKEHFLRSIRPFSSKIKLSERGHRALESVSKLLHDRLGRASTVDFLDSFRALIVWADLKYDSRQGTFERFVFKLFWKSLGEFESEIGKKKIARELSDQTLRDEAVDSEERLLLFLNRWRKKLSSLVLAFPASWSVPGLTDEELVDELELALLKVLRKPELFLPYEMSGYEATYRFLGSKKDYFRKKRKFFVAPSNTVVPLLIEEPINPEDALLEEEIWRSKQEAMSAAKESLSPILRKWLSAIELESGGWRKGKLNMARVAGNVGKNRSSALRARQSIQNAYEKAFRDREL